jgi:actin related protein 2/3 complex subunit 1A/1B
MQAITRGKSITCHAWNQDGTKCALCPNNNHVLIIAKDGQDWKLEHVLKQHDAIVTGIDWDRVNNRIVTCSQDRNAYVWHFDGAAKKWMPVLVILRINRCATHVRWSPKGDKFAVASGAKAVSVCHFEEDNDWWVSKHVKKHRSTVTRIAWHPNNQLLATASTDFKARIFNCAVREVDGRPIETAWGKARPFSDPLCEFDCSGWVQGINFSPSGKKLVFVGHDSTVSVAECREGQEPSLSVLKLKLLPMMDCIFLDETKIVVAGHDCAPFLVTQSGPDRWVVSKNLDEKKKAAAPAAAVSQSRAAFAMFQDRATKGTTDSSKLDTDIETKHQNAITNIEVYRRNPSMVTEFTTSGLDGAVHWWK